MNLISSKTGYIQGHVESNRLAVGKIAGRENKELALMRHILYCQTQLDVSGPRRT